MGKAVTIDLVVGDPAKVDAAFAMWDKGLSKLQKQTDQLKASISGVVMPQTNSGGGGGAIVRRSGGGAPGVLTSFQNAQVADAFSRSGYSQMASQAVAHAKNSLAQNTAAAYSGDPAAIRQMNAANAIIRRNTQKPAPTLGSKAMNALMTSRLGVGANGLEIAPLIGRLAALNPAVGATLAALGLLALGFKSAYSAINQSIGNRARFGAGAASMNAAAGIVGLEGGAVAAGVRSAIEGGGLGTAYAMSLGINPLQGPLGSMDYARNANIVMRDISKSKNYDEARRKAETMGSPELASLYYLSDARKNRIGKEGPTTTEETTRAMVELNAAMADLIKGGKQILSDFFAPIFEVFAEFSRFGEVFYSTKNGAKESRTAINELMKPLRDFTNWVKWLREQFERNTKSDEKWEMGPFGARKVKKSPEEMAADMRASAESAQVKALNDNTRSTDRLNHTFREGMHGGGARAGASMPRGLNGFQLGDASYQAAVASGVI
jgi:hypothetical protein